MGTANKFIQQADALELLTMQHDQVEELIEQLQEGDVDLVEKEMLFRQLGNSLAAHAEMEETLFYPSVLAKQTEMLVLESTEEHLAIRRILADMMDLRPDDHRFDAKLLVMKETFRHHARIEEEGELFPHVRRMFSAEELVALGAEMLSLYETILAREPLEAVPAQTEHAAQVELYQ